MSCLFRSLSNFHDGIGVHQLRLIICDYLLTDPYLGGLQASELIPLETGMNLQAYVNRMRLSNEWGGAIEIKAYCDLSGNNVNVFSYTNNRNIEFLYKKKSNIWNMIHWTGNHYEPIKSVIIPNKHHTREINVTKKQSIKNIDKTYSKCKCNTCLNRRY